MNIGFFMFIIIALLLLSGATYLVSIADDNKERRKSRAVLATGFLCLGILLLIVCSMVYKDNTEPETEVLGYSGVLL